jgi:hypothetical protein
LQDVREVWLTISATRRPIYIRYGEVHEVSDGAIVQSNCLWDVLDVMPIAPSLGAEGMWPGPITGDGPYSVTGGSPSVFAMHMGENFLGVGPAQRPAAMRVTDFYLHHEGFIRENWVPLDILDLLLQMAMNVIAHTLNAKPSAPMLVRGRL